MAAARDFIFGPWRAVPVLGITQILAWGSIFYTPVLIVPLIAAERSWSIAFTMGGFSVGLLSAGLVAPYVGHAIDRFGGRTIMTAGSLIGALGLLLIVHAAHPALYYGVWVVLGLAMAATLYDAAFATLGYIFGAGARRPITAITLAGGFASTVSWPVTHLLLERLGWEGTYLTYAMLLIFVAAPLHALVLPRGRAEVAPLKQGEVKPQPKVLPARGAPFILVATAFACYAFVPSGLLAHMLAIFTRSGIEPEIAVFLGALFGPAQVGARLIEFTFGRNADPLWIGRCALMALFGAFVLLAVFGLSPLIAAIFVLIFGGANGLVTIARGAVPLALFGPTGFGRLMGRLAKPFQLMQATAPLVMAVVIDRATDAVAFALAGSFATIALVCFLAIRRPV